MLSIDLPAPPTGYTLIEFLIIIAITSLLVLTGFSGYTKSQEKQLALSAKETIITVLQEAQTQASIGQNDCDGIFRGINITLNNSTISKTPICENNNGTATQTIIPTLTFSDSYTLTFLPLGNGVDLGGVTSLDINYVVNSINYQVNVSAPGIIMYNGIQ